ncbi:MAG: aldehyde dehydrogenase family protein [Candidatus Omnitrophota bacterium]
MKQRIINPSYNKVIAEVELVGKKEAETAIISARQEFDSGRWPSLTLVERRNFLLNISAGILDKAEELAKLETANTGKPIKETTFMDIPSSARTFEYFANNLERFLRQEETSVSDGARACLVRQPQGVVALIVPWNYPLLIASWKLAAALAAGNTVILKPSSLTPLTALELAKIINEAGLPRGAVNILVGNADTLGEALFSDPRVDMVSFTGSNEVGKKIIGYTAKSAKKLIMELGGKSASIVLKDADIEAAVNGCLCSIFLNQGQMCTAMSRILVAGEVYDGFVADFVAKAKRIRLGPADDFQTQMGPLISEAQRKRVINFVQKAEKEGARLLCGGRIPREERLKDGFFFEPAVFVDVKPGMEIFREEVFGPVASISRFSSPDEALALANDSEYGLAACIWSKDKNSAAELARKINAGAVWINTYGMFYNELPYGGFKQSGFGKELGREGFLEYTKLQNIVTDSSSDGKPLVNYWYGF